MENNGYSVPSSQSASVAPYVYRRARGAAISGLVIQLGLVIAVGLTGLWADTQAIYAATWHMIGGLPIWIILALLYHQHELERTQQLAAEKLAEDTKAAAIFGNLSDDLDAARERLNRLYRYGLPTVSAVVAAYLLVAGGSLVWIALTQQTAGESGNLSTACDPVGLMFVTAAIAFTSFTTARWLAGYARQEAWRLLRGGASYLMSCFVVTLLLFLAATAVSLATDQQIFVALAAGIPVLMMLVGVEILLTSLLESYRPRLAGEIPRPAFDSRVLGLLTAPESLGRVLAETISYQFGVEVSGSWLYRLLGQAVTPLTLLSIAVLTSLSCVTIVGPDERGMLLRFGEITGDPLPPGFHFKLPWPLETAENHPVGRVQEILISSDLTGKSRLADSILWTTDSDKDSRIGQEEFLSAAGDAEVEAAAAGVSLIATDVIVQYSVGDLKQFLLGSTDHRQALRLVAQREVSQYFAAHSIDQLLGHYRIAAGPVLRTRIQNRLNEMLLGIDVVGVAVTALHPPIGPVSRAFHYQIGAVQQKETAIRNAQRFAVRQLAQVAGSVSISQELDAAIRRFDEIRTSGDPQQVAAADQEIDALLAAARGEAAEIVHRARAYRWKRAVGEQASSDQFVGELLAYQAAPFYYRTRRFLEVLASGLMGRRKFVIAGDPGDTPVLQMDFSDPTSAIDTLLTD